MKQLLPAGHPISPLPAALPTSRRKSPLPAVPLAVPGIRSNLSTASWQAIPAGDFGENNRITISFHKIKSEGF